MSILVPFNGVNYIVPTPGETGWGSNLDSFFVAIGAGSLQKIGGSFLLANEVDFGASFGLKSLYYKSESANIAATGILRLNNNSDAISWRNAANSSDLALTVNGSNQLSFNGTPIENNVLTNAHILVGNVSNVATDVPMSGNIAIDNTGATTIQAGVIVNSMVNSSAAIAYSKLALTNSIVNADVNTSAAIAYSKLALTGSIVNADINAAAAIAYSKLTLTNSIVNADINAAAAIAYSKLALSNSIVNADINSTAAIAYSKLNLTGDIINADISVSAAIVYSKLSLTNSIVNADVNSAAAIAYSKLNLAGSIVNADINAAAAIAYSKLNLSASIVNADIATAAAIARSKLSSTETTDVTYASGKGMFWTDSGTNTVKLTAPTTITSTYTLKWPVAQGGSNQYLTNDGSGNLSWTNAAGTGTVNSGTQFQLAYYATSTNAVSGLTLITASRALASDANGLPVAATTTTTELNFVSGVTSAIQTQLSLKAPLASPTFTGVVTLAAGSVSAPSLSISGTGTGLYQVGANNPGLTLNGAKATDWISTGSSANTLYQPFNIYGGGGGNNKVGFDVFTQTSITTAKQVAQINEGPIFCLVYGGDGSNNDFFDIIVSMVNTTAPFVIFSGTSKGSPAARTYSKTGTLTVNVAMASGTYSTHSFALDVGAF